MARTVRMALLLLALLVVAVGAWLDRHQTTTWQHTVFVGLYPVAADDGAASAAYVAALAQDELEPVARFIAAEARAHGVKADPPVALQLHAPLRELPPALDPQAGPLGRALWSLRLRWYRWRAIRAGGGPTPQVALFLLYHDPGRAAVLPDSFGLQVGLMGVAHLFARHAQAGQNAIVVAHELMHVFGATDKYGDDGEPLYPDGYAEPALVPRLPQRHAELMAGRIAQAGAPAVMPDSLEDVRIGARTAREVGWPEAP